MVNEDKTPNIISEENQAQIFSVLARCADKVNILALVKDDNLLSERLVDFLTQLEKITDKISIKYEIGEYENALSPGIVLLDREEKFSGISYSLVPAGHELESFILAMYNVAGAGQDIDKILKERIMNLPKTDLKVFATLSCVLCPTVVQACQRITSLNPNITAGIVDLSYFPELRKKHRVMSVPAVIINDSKIIFGKKSIDEIVTHLESAL